MNIIKNTKKAMQGLFSDAASLPLRGLGSALACGLLFSACVDTVILPDDKTVDEDFWKTKADVQLMVNGAYSSMLTPDVISRLIVWSGLRSEEMLPVANLTGSLVEDLTEINLGNTQPDNVFARWSAFYSVINNCNLVLSRAEEVMAEDPSYTRGDYLSDRSQMLALRALCYFYLVRNFRDVPYVAEAFMNSSQNRNIPQVAPDSVISACINDLIEAQQNAISASAFNDWRRVGYFTRDGIQTLLADLYLWRGSVRHSAADYQACIDYCDKVIASKHAQHQLVMNETEQDYYWAEGRNLFQTLYMEQNAEESIFELQFNGQDYYNGKSWEGNLALCQYFAHASNGAAPYLYASSIFLNQSTVYTTMTGSAGVRDWRGLANTFNKTVTVGGSEALEIRKYVDNGTGDSRNAGNYSVITSTNYATKDRAYNTAYQQNYIIYRLSDALLMKAEALTALATADDDEAHLRQAFNLVQAVNSRSKTITNSGDSIHWVAFSGSIERMEELVLNERLREFAFEGKRWYDLLRYNYRHVEGVDYTTTLADQEERGLPAVENYNGNRWMTNWAMRKIANGSAVAAKINNERKLYMPIPQADLNVWPALRQNPAYGENNDFSKNY